MKGLPHLAYYAVLVPFLALTIAAAFIWSPRESAYLLAAFLTLQLVFRLSPLAAYVPHLRTKAVDAFVLIVMICALLYLAPWGNAF
ncbi:hypothetical protein [Arcanobacterium hippocoleae]|uniref:DUF3017 domain-containing protein n=1 Tax=Arcanobacterium hippocoleae TaxID=149017 RepID=A0ABU1T116_9ACTO|nr:hypothetical protein [Arcanobacterium hippocoleae]MDR6939055.1 hypothetical protein [Arcanobacterium hippocoleae]